MGSCVVWLPVLLFGILQNKVHTWHHLVDLFCVSPCSALKFQSQMDFIILTFTCLILAKTILKEALSVSTSVRPGKSQSPEVL